MAEAGGPDGGEKPRVGFVHLRVHSAYSLLEGALPLGKLLELAKADGQPALGLADTGNLFGALEFSEKASDKGIQPIVGCQLAVDFADHAGESGRRPTLNEKHPSLVLIAQTETGWSNLVRLDSRAFLGTEGAEAPHVRIADVEEFAEGLIALTGGPGGPIDRALVGGQGDLARRRIERLAAIFGDRLYVEIQRHGLDEEKVAEAGLIDLAYDMGLPLVATNEAFFPKRDDYEAHDALMAIAEGRVIVEEDRRRLTPEHWF